ncbi:MAG: 1,4-alpha-glucan branching protein domain-containing protein [Thermodesulfovibrionales bacterium]
MNGSLILFLHAHLPYVKHPEYEYSLEENWLFEAMRETYLPLLDILERMVNEGASPRLTLSFSPPLMEMLNDALLRKRFVRSLEHLIELAEQEVKRTARTPFAPLALFYRSAFRKTLRLYTERYRQDLLSAFRQLQAEGHIEVAATAATHAFLPAFAPFPGAVKSQIALGVKSYQRVFGRPPRGFWLPECGYYHGLDSFLKDAGIRYFFVETHGLVRGRPRPRHSVYRPALSPAGLSVFGRDSASARQVWCASRGYPGDPWYRDFYRDIGFDLPLEYTGGFTRFRGIKTFTGMKYYRVTGGEADKAPYDRAAALQRAAGHAAHFTAEREADFRKLLPYGFPPVILSAFDAELFGHWWFEGVEWLDMVLRGREKRGLSYRIATPSSYLLSHPAGQEHCTRIEPSSWGEGGYSEVWIGGRNHFLYRHLHAMADRMKEMAVRMLQGKEMRKKTVQRVLHQAMRETLLAQASDWAFLMEKDRASEYAERRVKTHLERFTLLHSMLMEGRADERTVGELEERDGIFPWLSWPGDYSALLSASSVS